MNSVLESMILILVLGSFLAWSLTFFITAKPALVAGYGAVVLLFILGRNTAPILFAFAIFSPIGIVLPALSLGRVASRLGYRVKRFALWELSTALCLLVVFYASVAGVFQTDFYSFGYSAKGASFLCIVVCVYGLLTGRTSAIVLALLAKLLWLFGLVSENIFDVFGHFLLVFVFLVEFTVRLFEMSAAKLRARRG